MLRRLLLALFFLTGGLAEEIRHPTQCDTVSVRRMREADRRRRGSGLQT
jgi:hypothetical protein